MNPFWVAATSLRRFPVFSCCMAALLALAVGLGTAVALLEPSLRQGATAAAKKFDILVGAPGSENQLVLSTVYLDPAPLPVLDGSVVAHLAADPGVRWLSPVLLGDTFQRMPLVGVDSAFLEGAGRFEQPMDAFAGARTGLKPGQSVRSVHGPMDLDGRQTHAQAYTVRGVLPFSGTPWDKAILVSAASLRQLHAKHGHEQEEAADMTPLDGKQQHHASNQIQEQAQATAPIPSLSGPMSALVVRVRGVADAYRLRALLRTERSMALFPAEVLLRLYSLLGDVQSLLTGMARLAQGAVLAGVLMAIFAGLPLRRKTLAVLRALGAPRLYTALTLWLEIFCSCCWGGLTGLALGYGLSLWGAEQLAARTGLLAPVRLNAQAWLTFALTVGVGSLAALLPAAGCYRISAARALRQ